jgi:hypothetical protein
MVRESLDRGGTLRLTGFEPTLDVSLLNDSSQGFFGPCDAFQEGWEIAAGPQLWDTQFNRASLRLAIAIAVAIALGNTKCALLAIAAPVAATFQ